MPTYTPAQWARHLRRVARDAAGGEPPRSTAIGRAFAAACALGPGPFPEAADATAEVGLWWALAGAELPRRPDDAVLVKTVDDLLGEGGDGPLWPALRARGLEVWTEAELCGLHALWGLALLHRRRDWSTRAEAVRDWHLENTQPDNATNRPWALHVFLLSGSPEGVLYADTLLHNALVTGPEPFSARILLDSAAWLERPTATPAQDTPRARPPGRT